MWAKKFKQLLDASAENIELKTRVTSLETQIVMMQEALGSVMKSYVDLAKITMDHRQSLEEVLTYLTSLDAEEDQLHADEEDTEDELAERKRLMN